MDVTMHLPQVGADSRQYMSLMLPKYAMSAYTSIPNTPAQTSTADMQLVTTDY